MEPRYNRYSKKTIGNLNIVNVCHNFDIKFSNGQKLPAVKAKTVSTKIIEHPSISHTTVEMRYYLSKYLRTLILEMSERSDVDIVLVNRHILNTLKESPLYSKYESIRRKVRGIYLEGTVAATNKFTI